MQSILYFRKCDVVRNHSPFPTRGTMMTPYEIEAFLAVTKYKTLSAAAKELHITQPALSRRLKTLESEIGITLFERQQGVREVTLTPGGQRFSLLAQKWLQVWQETAALARHPLTQPFCIAAIERLSLYLLPPLIRTFLNQVPTCQLTFRTEHTIDAYRYMNQGIIDVALVGWESYSKGFQCRPAFQEPFVLLTADPHFPEAPVPLSSLSPEKELRLPWSDAYDRWHARHFDEQIPPYLSIDQTALIPTFLTGNTWAIVPYTTAKALQNASLHIFPLNTPPPAQIIYVLTQDNQNQNFIRQFLSLLHKKLQADPQIQSYLDTFL